MTRPIKKKKRLSSFQIIILGFVGVILLGALLLMLPISSQDRVVTPFNQTLFTSTSAVCVTGLIVQDTATHWSLFGQIIILALIQVGGLGVITMAASFVLLSGKRFSFSQRNTMQNAISAPSLGGIVRLTKFVVKGTAIIEVTGAVIMMPVFVQSHGARGVWMAIFHSVSAFCNAGFDLMGTPDRKFASLTALSDHPVVNIVIMLLIIIGGIGFMTWRDVITNKFRFKRYRLQSKIVIATSAILIAIPALLYFFYDFAQLPIAQRIFGSLFQAVTPRTAGFNTLDLNSMSKFGLAVMIILMLIGGSPGSTAGGMKTVTVAVLFKNAIASFKRKEDPECFGRRIESGTVKTATTLFLMYFTLCFMSAAVISMVEDLPFGVCIFETASAVGTVGLTLGITPGLGVISQVILILLMFLGRVGGLTIIYAALSGSTMKLTKLPKESITVG